MLTQKRLAAFWLVLLLALQPILSLADTDQTAAYTIDVDALKAL